MSPKELIALLLKNKNHFITGVPDSIFKHLIIEVKKDNRFEHVITNNEGESCALAAGYHLATGKVPIVYMQNSGLGNTINPLTSLLDENIYSIPALLLIGWRAVPGQKDEPQHKTMGAILPDLLNLLGIPYAIAENNTDMMNYIFQQAASHFKAQQKPFAILFPKDVIKPDTTETKITDIPEGSVIREALLELIIKNSKKSDVLITTTGKTSRELYEIRERLGQDHSSDFLTVGSMGCAASIALGVAMQQKNRRVILIDGDGACLMRMEALATIGAQQPENLFHILVDNNAYESTGSQQTLSNKVDFSAIATACNYPNSTTVDTLTDFEKAFGKFNKGPNMLVVKSFPYSRSDLGRPKTTPIENKMAFMEQLGASTCKP